VQITWYVNHRNDADDFFRVNFASKKLKKWEIKHSREVGDACVDVTVAIRYRLFGEYRKRVIIMRVIGEKDVMKPDPDGTWGVNPISALRGLN